MLVSRVRAFGLFCLLAVGPLACAADDAPYSPDAEPDSPTTSVSRQWSLDELEDDIRSDAMRGYLDGKLLKRIEASPKAVYHADWARCINQQQSRGKTNSTRTCTVYELPSSRAEEVVDALHIVADVLNVDTKGKSVRLDVYYHRRGDSALEDHYAGHVTCTGNGKTCATSTSIRLSLSAEAATPPILGRIGAGDRQCRRVSAAFSTPRFCSAACIERLRRRAARAGSERLRAKRSQRSHVLRAAQRSTSSCVVTKAAERCFPRGGCNCVCRGAGR
jgi:hypothetical protein